MRVRPIFAWYDMWVGVFWDRTRRKLYVLPLPMVGLAFDFGARRVLPESVACGCDKCLADVLAVEREASK